MRPPVSDRCPECGTALPAGGACHDHFHALLLLESQVPGGPGSLAHFCAVSSYALQHPEGMNLTAAALAGLRESLAELDVAQTCLDRALPRLRQHRRGHVHADNLPGPRVCPKGHPPADHARRD